MIDNNNCSNEIMEIFEETNDGEYKKNNADYKLINAYKKGYIYLVHVLNSFPPSFYSDLVEYYDSGSDSPSERLSLHMASNKMVEPHPGGSWENNKYAIIINAKDVLGRVIGLQWTDTTIMSGIKYNKNNTHFIIPENDVITHDPYYNDIIKITNDENKMKNILIDILKIPKENVHEYKINPQNPCTQKIKCYSSKKDYDMGYRTIREKIEKFY